MQKRTGILWVLILLGFITILNTDISLAGYDPNVTITTNVIAGAANNTETNDDTTQINFKPFFNGTGRGPCWIWVKDNTRAKATASFRTANTSVMTNATSVSINSNALTTGTNYYGNVTCQIKTATKVNRTSKRFVFEVNRRPTISAVADDLSNTIAAINKVITFTVTWADFNSTSDKGDGNTIHLCKTDSFASGACPGGNWCQTSTDETDNSTTCTYTVVPSDGAGTKKAYTFANDNNDLNSSAGGTPITFKLGGTSGKYLDEGGDYLAPSDNNASKLSSNVVFWSIIAVVAIVIFYFTVIKKKS